MVGAVLSPPPSLRSTDSTPMGTRATSCRPPAMRMPRPDEDKDRIVMDPADSKLKSTTGSQSTYYEQTKNSQLYR